VRGILGSGFGKNKNKIKGKNITKNIYKKVFLKNLLRLKIFLILNCKFNGIEANL